MFSLLSAASNDFVEAIGSFFFFAKQAFVGFGPSDAVDILILTLIFTLAVRFFKNRKAGALIAGIIICLVILVLATLFNLAGVKFIFSGIFRIGFIAVVK